MSLYLGLWQLTCAFLLPSCLQSSTSWTCSFHVFSHQFAIMWFVLEPTKTFYLTRSNTWLPALRVYVFCFAKALVMRATKPAPITDVFPPNFLIVTFLFFFVAGRTPHNFLPENGVAISLILAAVWFIESIQDLLAVNTVTLYFGIPYTNAVFKKNEKTTWP